METLPAGFHYMYRKHAQLKFQTFARSIYAKYNGIACWKQTVVFESCLK